MARAAAARSLREERASPGGPWVHVSASSLAAAPMAADSSSSSSGSWWDTFASVSQVIGSNVLAGATAAVSFIAATAVATVAVAPSAVAAITGSSADPLARADILRAEAHRLKADRDRHFQASQDCYARGDGAGAKLASDQRKQVQSRIDSLRAQAAALLFAHHNAERGLDQIDLHGLFVEEALKQLTIRIESCEARIRAPPADGIVVRSLVVIVGRGNHSRDKVAKLRPAVEQLIAKHQLRVTPDQPNAGCLTIEFGSSKPSGWVGAIGEHCIVQ